MKVGILDYDQGNIKSLKNAIFKVGYTSELVSVPDQLKDYDIIFLPGVGAFDNAMKNLKMKGFIEPIKQFVANDKKLVGICLGMQLLFEKSYEFGEHEGIGLIEGEVRPFKENINLNIPHVGWNGIICNEDYSDLNGDYYFVHSYYCKVANPKNIFSTSHYGIEFCSAVKNNNIIGLQFHPEKSQKKGLELLEIILNE